MTNAVFENWLSVQRQYDAEQAAVDHYALAGHADELTAHVRKLLVRVFAGAQNAYDGLYGSLGTEPEHRACWERGRDDYIEDLVGSLHAIGSALTVVGCSDRELSERYLKRLEAPSLESSGDADQTTCSLCRKEVAEGDGVSREGDVVLCVDSCVDAYDDAVVARAKPPITDDTSVVDNVKKL